MNEKRFRDEEINGFLKELIYGHRLDDPALGIAKFVIDNGYDSLSSKQRFVFEKAMDDYCYDECMRCGNDIPWSEMSSAEDNGGICSWCEKLSASN